MPYTQAHKARTRARIVEGARALFNRRGFEQVTIDEVMAAAGLTRGGFYNHFRSKDELYAESVRSFSSCNPFRRRIAALAHPPSGRELARQLVELYLSDTMLRAVDDQCPLYALPSDVARAGLAPRAAYTDVLRSMTRVFRGAFDPRDRDADRKAQLMVSLCVGGMVLARTTNDRKLRRSLRETAHAQVLALMAT